MRQDGEIENDGGLYLHAADVRAVRVYGGQGLLVAGVQLLERCIKVRDNESERERERGGGGKVND